MKWDLISTSIVLNKFFILANKICSRYVMFRLCIYCNSIDRIDKIVDNKLAKLFNFI